jgi:hypothetical protein
MTFAFMCPSYIPDDDSLYVLETVAGFSKKHGIKVGTNVDFQLIRWELPLVNFQKMLNLPLLFRVF